MKRLQLLFLVSIALLLTSCFEVIEDITIHENGTGHVKIILNASQSKSDINALLLLKEVNGHKIPSIAQIKSKIVVVEDSIEAIDGFSNVSLIFDDLDFILVLEADFDRVERLNEGVYKLWQKSDPVNAKRELYFSYASKKFIRQPGQLFGILYDRMKTTDKKVLENSSYTALYRFDENILTQKNTSAKISTNKKVVFLKLPLQLMIEKPSYWYNKISLN